MRKILIIAFAICLSFSSVAFGQNSANGLADVDIAISQDIGDKSNITSIQNDKRSHVTAFTGSTGVYVGQPLTPDSPDWRLVKNTEVFKEFEISDLEDQVVKIPGVFSPLKWWDQNFAKPWLKLNYNKGLVQKDKDGKINMEKMVRIDWDPRQHKHPADENWKKKIPGGFPGDKILGSSIVVG